MNHDIIEMVNRSSDRAMRRQVRRLRRVRIGQILKDTAAFLGACGVIAALWVATCGLLVGAGVR